MSHEDATGTILVLGFVALAAGASMYVARGGMRGGTAPNRAYHVAERSFIIAAVILTAIGLVLLSDLLQGSDGAVLARAGAVAYLFGGVLVVTAEASALGQGVNEGWSEQLWALAITYVVVALVAQAVVGASLLMAGLLPAWVGWVTMGWNIGFLVLYLVKRGDIYTPVVHHLMTLIIGAALLLDVGT